MRSLLWAAPFVGTAHAYAWGACKPQDVSDKFLYNMDAAKFSAGYMFYSFDTLDQLNIDQLSRYMGSSNNAKVEVPCVGDTTPVQLSCGIGQRQFSSSKCVVKALGYYAATKPNLKKVQEIENKFGSQIGSYDRMNVFKSAVENDEKYIVENLLKMEQYQKVAKDVFKFAKMDMKKVILNAFGKANNRKKITALLTNNEAKLKKSALSKLKEVKKAVKDIKLNGVKTQTGAMSLEEKQMLKPHFKQIMDWIRKYVRKQKKEKKKKALFKIWKHLEETRNEGASQRLLRD